MRRREAMGLAGTLSLATAAALALVAGLASAQAPDNYEARLSWVPISGAERGDVGGHGSATATLTRSRLAISGTFEGLPGPATLASLRFGVATGARGPAIAQLEITRAASGRFSGTVELDRDQRAALLAGHLYIQLHAERGVAPDNAVLWGWLLAAAPTSAGTQSEPR